MEAVIQKIELPELKRLGITLAIKREDLLFPMLSGNKYRKLKYNLRLAGEQGHTTLITFGGAFSNHLHATAAAGQQYGFRTIGFVRGEELDKQPLNPTLSEARDRGMQLEFISRERYRKKADPVFIGAIQARHGRAYFLPEGGTNELAIKGCEEILGAADRDYTHICCAVGTGGTLAGIVRAARSGQKVQGYPALRASGLGAALGRWIPGKNWELIEEYHFGGYAKIDRSLIDFINEFHELTGVPLDPVYTGKMIYGILQEIQLGRIEEGSSILAIHTGGLQGTRGMNMRLQKKNLPLLHL
ncbi:MAG: pyridoxal-phosphate dependent enzyme [Robiginitalea sp.]